MHAAVATCARLCQRYEDSAAALEGLSRHADSLTDRIRVAVLAMRHHQRQGQLTEAIQAGRGGLSLLGIALPSERDLPTIAAVKEAKRAVISALLRGDPVSAVASLPDLPAPLRQLAAELLNEMTIPTTGTFPELHALVSMLYVQAGLQYDLSDSAVFACLVYTFDLSGSEDYEEASALLRYAINRYRGTARLRQHSEILAMSGITAHLMTSLDRGMRYLDSALEAARRCNHDVSIAYSISHRTTMQISAGGSLEAVCAEVERLIGVVRRTGIPSSLTSMQVSLALLSSLQGETSQPTELSLPGVPESRLRRDLSPGGFADIWFKAAKMTALILNGEYPRACSFFAAEVEHRHLHSGFYASTELALYAALALSGSLLTPGSEVAPAATSAAAR